REKRAHQGLNRLLDHFIALVGVGLELIDFDAVILAAFDALRMGAVPEDRDRAACVERELMMAAHLDQLRGLDRLVLARPDIQRAQDWLLGIIRFHHGSLVEKMNFKNEKMTGKISFFPENLIVCAEALPATPSRRVRAFPRAPTPARPRS